jgi:four helix bundle suffix protein
MVQAGRSGRQNLAEGSQAAAASSQTELRLLNTARSSLEELLLDYEDCLRHRHLPQWSPDSPEALAVRQVPYTFRQDRSDQSDQSDQSDLTDLTDQQRWALYAPWLEHDGPAVRANALICLIHQANYLLDQQIAALEKRFVDEGGYSEQLAAARLAERNRKRSSDPSGPSDPSDPSDPSSPTGPADRIPACPQCGKPMVLRTARLGRKAGQQFWGCSAYPDCKGVVEL